MARAVEDVQRARGLDEPEHDDQRRRGLPEQARACYLTANAFSVVGQPLLLGRDFGPQDEKRGTDRAVIIGYRIWRNRYAGDPGIVGKLTRVNGEPESSSGSCRRA